VSLILDIRFFSFFIGTIWIHLNAGWLAGSRDCECGHDPGGYSDAVNVTRASGDWPERDSRDPDAKRHPEHCFFEHGFRADLAQNTASANSKDSATASSSGSLQAAPSVHADGSVASGPAVASQIAAPPAAASPIATAAATAPVGGQAALANPPANPATTTAGNTTNLVPATPQTPIAAPPGPVQVAQMVSRIEQSEMRIGMNTSAFGSVEVRTTIHASDVGLVIGSEKGDLRGVLASDMPAIANSLQQQNLRLNSVNFMQGFAFSNNSPGGGGSEQQGFVPTRATPNGTGAEAPVEASMEAATTGGGGGLSILA
jgi:flagellar hook-length control protein FliK